jgi:MFS family permease
VSARAEQRSGNRLVLPVVLAGTFMAILDVAIVNVAIPSIRKDLHASFGGVELVITAYTLTYACLLVTGGRLGDLFGRRRMFIAGLLLFSASSALCGAAPSIGVLIAARAVQGIGGALMYPQVLAIIQVTY